MSVILNDSPTQDIINKSLEEFTVIDSRNRKITLRKPKALAQLRLVQALGDLAKNMTYMSMVSSLLWVYKVDDDFVPQLNNLTSIEGLWDRLDDEGLEAVAKALQERLGTQKTVEETLQEIKK